MILKGLLILGFIAISQAFLYRPSPKFIQVRHMIKKVPVFHKVPVVKKKFIPIIKHVPIKVPHKVPVYIEKEVKVPVYIDRPVHYPVHIDNGKGGSGGMEIGINNAVHDADTVNIISSVGVQGGAGGPIHDGGFDNNGRNDNGFNGDGLNVDNGAFNGFDNNGLDNGFIGGPIGGSIGGSVGGGHGDSFIGGSIDGGHVDGFIGGSIDGGHIDGFIGGQQQAGPGLIQDVQQIGHGAGHLDQQLIGGKSGQHVDAAPIGHF